MRKFKLFVLFVIAAALPTQPFAQGNKPTTVTNPGAVVKFSYCATAPDPAACEISNRVRNDYDYPYTNGADGVSAVFNLVSGSKDLTIGLTTSHRSVWMDFTDRVSGSAPSPAWWATGKSQNVKPYFNVLKAYRAKELCTTFCHCNERRWLECFGRQHLISVHVESGCNNQARQLAGNKLSGQRSLPQTWNRRKLYYHPDRK